MSQINELNSEEVLQAQQPVSVQDLHEIQQYMKGIYDYLSSTAPDGFANEAFRLPPAATRAQRSLFDFVQGHSCAERPETARENLGAGREDGEFAEVTPQAQQPAPVQEPVAWMVRNGCADYQLMCSKAQADALAAEMQKRHDLSGSLASFVVCPL